MKWNWQQDNWPEFTYREADLALFEREFHKRAGMLLGAYQHVDADEQQALYIAMISEEALKTSEIEGEYLNRESIQSSIRRQFGLQASEQKVSKTEEGIAQMMVDLYRTFQEPLSAEMLHRWHAMIMKGRTDLDVMGAYRRHKEAMQVVSGYIHKPTIHFEAPPSGAMSDEMDAYISWFNDNRAQPGKLLPALIHAGLAHLYFVSIHPYEDGNGRIARALTEKALAQAVGQPTLIALSQAIQAKRKAYYPALEDNNKTLDVTNWLVYFSETVLDAQDRAQRLLNFTISKGKMLSRLQGKLNARQEKVLLKMFKAGPEGFEGGMSAEKYIKITGTTRATATRDLTDLVAKGVFRKTGQLKGTRYWLAIEI